MIVYSEIISLNLPKIVISEPNKLERVVIVSSTTLVRRFQEEAKVSDLKTGDFVVVLGNPNDVGEIEAKLLRIMPVPPQEKNK